MAEVTLDHVAKRFGNVSVIEDLNLDIQDHEFMVLRRPLRLRQVHRAADDRGTGGDHRRRRSAIGDRVVNDLPPKDRDIAMVFQNYALYPHMTVAREPRVRPARSARRRRPRSNALVHEAAQILEHHEPSRPQAEAALGRTAPAGRPRPGDRPQTRGLPLRRAALEPRRQAARADARRDQEAPAAAEDHDRLRHARPDRGDDHGPPHRGDEGRQDPAGRHAARGLRPPGEPLRRAASSARRR